MKTWIGVDPGEKGAVGFMRQDSIGPVGTFVFDCPSTIQEIARIVKNLVRDEYVFIAIEKVNPYYKSSAKSAFTFGMNFAAWQMAFAYAGIPYTFVTPRKWQSVVYDSAKKLDNPKKQSYELASRLFPGLELKTKRGKILDGRTDAILIAEYCRRVN